MLNEQTIDHNVTQGIASYIGYLNNIRLVDLMNALDSILTSETEQLSDIATKTAKALSHIDWTKIEIDNLIHSNRGGDTGLHGFISEFAETGIRNARDTFQKLQISVELLNDNGLADLLIDGKEVQMKFYNNISEGIKQASNYREMKMIIPKDHVELIKEIMSGAKPIKFRGDELSESKINNIRKLIQEESAQRGTSSENWLQPSVHEYKDVQKETIHETLAKESKDINKQADEQKYDVKKEVDEERLSASQQAKPSFGEATKVAGVGAAVQGGLNLAILIYEKRKEGKDLWDFDGDDWKECGVNTAKGALKGGISGYSIYGLTNVCHLAAPSAGAITSGTFGLSNAIIKYRKGDVDADGFIDLVTLNAIDATGAAIGASIGQVVIPIPVVGALVGSIMATTALSLGKGILNKQEIKIINLYQERIAEFIDKLDEEYQVKLEDLLNKYHKLGELQHYSFDFDINVQLRFVSSINLAKLVGVTEKSILKNENQIDEYFLG